MKINLFGWKSIKSPIGRQMLAGACANLMTAVNGASSAWMTANFLTLQNEDSSLPSGPLTLTEASMVLSIFYAGGMIGNFVAPVTVRRFGSKRVILSTAFPQMAVFSLFAWATNVYYLYAASVLSGFVAACHMVSMPVFVTEIVDDEYRGTINSFFDIFDNTGIVIAFFLAMNFDHAVQAKVLFILPVLFLMAFAGIPQTPQHLINRTNRKAAIEANLFFKGKELEILSEDHAKDVQEKSKLILSDFTNHRALRAIFITFTMMILVTFQGSMILTNYVTEIFSTTNPNTSPLYASTIVTIVLLLASLVFTFIVDRFNRRTLYIWSATTTGTILTFFAVYLMYLANDPKFDWAPVVFVSTGLFVTYLGMINVTWLIMIEVMPVKIKHFGISACSFIFMADNFIFTAIYPYVKEHIGLLGWIVIFAASCFFTAIFGFLFVPETRGKSHAEIMKMLDE